MTTLRSVPAFLLLLALLPGCQTNTASSEAAPLDASRTMSRRQMHQPPPAPPVAPTVPNS